jgi:DNA-binding GntR family transcriptional regulator
VAALHGKLSPDELAELRLLADAIVTAAQKGDVVAYLEADTTFHTTLLGLSGNTTLVELVTDLRNRTRLYGLDSLLHGGKLVDSAAEHLELVRVLDSGRAAEVTKLMRRHLGHVRGIWAATD